MIGKYFSVDDGGGGAGGGSAEPAFRCRACGGTAAVRTWKQRERAYRLSGEFYYGECAGCGALSIAEVPEDLARYYVANYRAHARAVEVKVGKFERLTLGADPTRRRLIERLVPDRGTRMLDVGCANGRLLRGLAASGYRRLQGVDRFLPEGLEQVEPFPMLRQGLAECAGDWEVIMYHHVLEHVAEPAAELRLARERLRPGGRLIVVVPLADAWVRERYGLDWPQWDAPRHLWLPTRRAMQRLAEAANLVLEASADDSTLFPLWVAPLYAKGVTLAEAGPLIYRSRWRPWTLGWLGWCRLHAWWLNRRRRGDEGWFVLRRPLSDGAKGG